MAYHGRVGDEFRQTVEHGAVATRIQQLNTIMERLKQRSPLRPKDLIQFKTTYLKMIDAMPAHIHGEVKLLGRDNDKTLHADDISLMIPAHNTNVHMFCADSYELERFRACVGIRAFPLGISNAAHLAFKKISRTPVVFHYNEKFMFILGSAILMHQALQHETVSEQMRDAVFIPTSQGLYMGGIEDVTLRDSMPYRRRELTLGRNHMWKQRVMSASVATDIPDNVIMLRTSIGLSDCGQDKHSIYEQLHAILSPVKTSGLLKTLCMTYEENGDGHMAAMQQAQPAIDALVNVITGPAWQRSASRRAESIKERPPMRVFGVK